jgi:hypothetical protein
MSWAGKWYSQNSGNSPNNLRQCQGTCVQTRGINGLGTIERYDSCLRAAASMSSSFSSSKRNSAGAGRGVASIGVLSSGNLCVGEEYA